MEKLKGTKPENWNNSKEKEWPSVHNNQVHSCSKTSQPSGSRGLNWPAKVVRVTSVQTLKLEPFLSWFCWFPVGPGGVTLSCPQCIPYSFCCEIPLSFHWPAWLWRFYSTKCQQRSGSILSALTKHTFIALGWESTQFLHSWKPGTACWGVTFVLVMPGLVPPVPFPALNC